MWAAHYQKEVLACGGIEVHQPVFFVAHLNIILLFCFCLFLSSLGWFSKFSAAQFAMIFFVRLLSWWRFLFHAYIYVYFGNFFSHSRVYRLYEGKKNPRGFIIKKMLKLTSIYIKMLRVCRTFLTTQQHSLHYLHQLFHIFAIFIFVVVRFTI